MKILIIGASGKKSIGSLIAARLECHGHEVTLASRSGKMGEKCDVTKLDSIERIMRKVQPEVVIHAAGMVENFEPLGKIVHWEEITSTIIAKTVGALMLLDAAVRHCVAKVIFLAGAEVSEDPRFGAFTAANNALWSITQFANKHGSVGLMVYYLNLGLVADSAVGERYLNNLEAEEAQAARSTSIDSRHVANVVREVLGGVYSPMARISVNNGTI